MTSDTTSSDRLFLDLAKRECRAMPLILPIHADVR
jgi:hypothetical protein